MQYFFPRRRLYKFLILFASISISLTIWWQLTGGQLPILLSLFILLMLFALAYFLFLVIWKICLRKKHKRLLDVLIKECDADRFLALYAPGIERIRNSNFPDLPEWDEYKIYYALGLFNTGNVAGAIDVVQHILALEMPKPGINAFIIFNRTTCSNDLATFCLEEGRIQEAKAALQEAKSLLPQCKQNSNYAAIGLDIAINEYYLMFLEGDAESALQYFNVVLPTARNPYVEVHTHEMIARVYEKLGDEGQRRQHLAFVAENGGTLAVAKQARAVLAAMAEKAQPEG